jgi:hypothetical protein
MKTAFIALALLLIGCTASPTTDRVESASTTPSVSTNATTYTPGATIVVSWSRLPGNATDWIAIAPVGSSPSTVTHWKYTAGATDGTANFAVSVPGSYVARAFAADSYEVLDESAPFDVATAGGVTTDQPTYAAGAPITVSWSALPGNQNDWIALAPAGSDVSSVIRYVYTNGAAAGSHVFTGLPTGNYVARAFLDDSYALLSEAAFAVTGVSVTHDRAGYVAGAPITITWSGLPGTSTDWIGLAPEGSSATTVTAWAYTGGATSGSRVFTLGTSGRFVARAFPSDSYTIAGESSPFTNGLTLTTDLASYPAGGAVTVSWDQLPGNANDWIAIAPQGSPLTTVTAWIYSNGAASGAHVFTPANGTYVARAFLDDSYVLLVESAPVVVGTTVPPPQATISVELATIGWGQDIKVTWASFPTNPKDWVAIAPAGSPPSTITQWVYTGGAASGTYTFAGGAPSPGNYVARGFLNDTSTMIAESTPFVVQESCVPIGPGTPQPGDDDFTGIGNPQPVTINTFQSGESRTLLCLEEATTLQVTGNGLASLSAPRLRLLTDNLDLDQTTSVSLPRLATVDDIIMRPGMGLTDVTLPALTSARAINGRVRRLIMPALATLQGPVILNVDGLNLGLVTMLPNNLSLQDESTLTVATFTAPELLRVTGNVGFRLDAPPDLPKLQRIDGEAELRAPELVLPSLQYMFTFISVATPSNVQPVLTKLLMPSIQRVENIFQVQGNPQLPQCQVDAILAQLSPPPNLVTVGGNGGVCPP